MECENRQWGLRLWSKTNLTFGKGFEQLNLFRAAQNIPYLILLFVTVLKYKIL